MDPVIIMVGRVNEFVYDVEVMPDIPAADLADAIAEAFGWQGVYDIEVFGRKVLPNQTLADVAAWDGAHLTFVKSSRTPPSKKSSSHTAAQSSAAQSHVKDPRALQQLKVDETPASSKTRSLKLAPQPKDDPVADTPFKSWKSIDPNEKERSPASPTSPVVGWKFAVPSDDPEKQDPVDSGTPTDNA